MKSLVTIATVGLVAAAMVSCEKEQTFRTVRFMADVPNSVQYHATVLIAPNAPFFDADTTGQVVVEFTGEVGDTVVYSVGTLATSAHAELVVNGQMVVVTDLQGGPLPKNINGRFILK